MIMLRTKFIDEALYFIVSYVEQSDFHGHPRSLKFHILKRLAELRDGADARCVDELAGYVRDTQTIAAYLALAGAQLSARDYESATTTLDVLLYQHPALPEAGLVKGITYWEAGDHTQARELIHHAVHAKPTLWSGWKVLIEMALHRDDRQDAQQLLAEALWHNPRRTDLSMYPFEPATAHPSRIMPRIDHAEVSV